MLILTRRIGQKIIIDNDITITLLDVKGQQARIGVDAPKDVSVNREEIQDLIDRETKWTKENE